VDRILNITDVAAKFAGFLRFGTGMAGCLRQISLLYDSAKDVVAHIATGVSWTLRTTTTHIAFVKISVATILFPIAVESRGSAAAKSK
jgi:hypothetical protein